MQSKWDIVQHAVIRFNKSGESIKMTSKRVNWKNFKIASHPTLDV